MAAPLARVELDSPHALPHRKLRRLDLGPAGDQNAVETAGDGLVVRVAWGFEVQLTVEGDRNFRQGHRFAHTAIPDSDPLHGEAIDAGVLAALSGGRRLLRRNSIFEPDRACDSVALEAWQESNDPIEVRNGSLAVRELSLLGA